MPQKPDLVQLLRALAHPIRMELLLASARRDISPAQFARRIGEPVANVTYHFRRLERMGWIEMVRCRPVQGTVEHFYRGAFAPAFEMADRSGRYFAELRMLLEREELEHLQDIVDRALEKKVYAQGQGVARRTQAGEADSFVLVTLLGFERQRQRRRQVLLRSAPRADGLVFARYRP